MSELVLFSPLILLLVVQIVTAVSQAQRMARGPLLRLHNADVSRDNEEMGDETRE